MARVFFLTCSRYDGDYMEEKHIMSGLGAYYFANEGGIYRGIFTNGRFNGIGQIKLGAPYDLIIKGKFEKGELKSIYDIIFPDRLTLHGFFNGEFLDCSTWKYCKGEDRRYVREVLFGLCPVVMDKENSTRILPPREVPPGFYDNEEGFLTERNYISSREPPLSPFRFITCEGEENWIKKNCRFGGKVELTDDICASIIRNNLDAQISTGSFRPCDCSASLNRNAFLEKVCEKQAKRALFENALYDKNEFDVPKTPSSTSRSSFSVDSVPIKLLQAQPSLDENNNTNFFGHKMSLVTPRLNVGFIDESATRKTNRLSTLGDLAAVFV